MKQRTGFVSNSSSSSFCIIGTSYQMEEIAKKDGVNNESFGHGMAEGKILEYHGNGFDDEYGDVLGGLEASRLLETMTIPEAKLHLQKIIKRKFDVEVPIDEIEFSYGERGTD